MPNETSISEYIDQIQEATYGQQVRSAIANAISVCYNDVTSSVTTLDAAMEGIEDATNSANDAADAATAAQADFVTAKNRYDEAYTQGNSYVSQLNSIKTQTDSARANAESAATSASSSATSASSSASLALGYLQDIRSYNIDDMDARLDAIETAETTMAGYVSDTLGYKNAAEAARTRAVQAETSVAANTQTVSDIYDDIQELDIPSVATELSDFRNGLSWMETLETTFSGYSTTFSGYDTTFSGYSSSFAQYNTDFTSIHDSIEETYSDIQSVAASVQADSASVSEIKDDIDALDFEGIATRADAALTTAEDSLDEIRSEMAALEEMDLDQKIASMSDYYNGTVEYAQRAEDSVQDLTESIEAAISASESANSKVAELATLQTSLESIQNTWYNSMYSSIQSNLSAMTEAVSSAQNASTVANTASERAEAALDRADTVSTDWSARKTQMDVYLADVQTAITSMEAATESIEDMTVTSEAVSYTTPASAEITDVDGHKNIHFYLQKGEPGPGNVIKGSVYSTLSALQQDITDPEVGDQYNVGTSTPYNIYRWTGTEWENEGPYGVAFDNLTNSEIDTIYGTQTSVSGGKYIDSQGLTYYTRNKILPALSGKVDAVNGKGLSTNDFTNTYKDQIGTLQTTVDILSSSKVDAVSGKGLSTNDFTNDYKNQITSNASSITSLSSSKLNSDFSALQAFSGTEWLSGLLAVRHGTSLYKLTISDIISYINSVSDYVQTSQVATLSEATDYLGL